MFKKKPLSDDAPKLEGAGDAPSPGPRLRRKIILIAGLAGLSVVALLGGLMAALGPSAAMAVLTGAPTPEESAAPLPDDANPPPPGAELVVMPFEEMIVNISATAESGRQISRFLKVDLALVYDRTQDSGGLVEARHIFLRDAFQDYLRQLAERDLEGTLGLITVKGELLRRARAIAGSDAPHEMVITGLVIQ
ncbi:MAG: flagellar basal body-associated FliL family protein [Paracoccaceae bacterium]|nr:flagellar basal body-associated FliL family protein [Paracoccaceae bacterium]